MPVTLRTRLRRSPITRHIVQILAAAQANPSIVERSPSHSLELAPAPEQGQNPNEREVLLSLVVALVRAKTMWLGQFGAELTLSYIAVFIGWLIVAIIGAFVSSTTTLGHALDLVVEGPGFAITDASAAFCAFLVHRRTRKRPSSIFGSSNAGLFVWLVPTAVVVWNIFTWDTYPNQGSYWRDVWNNYFGSQCGSSECLYEMTVTAPFYASVAYSVVRWVLRRRADSADEPSPLANGHQYRGGSGA